MKPSEDKRRVRETRERTRRKEKTIVHRFSQILTDGRAKRGKAHWGEERADAIRASCLWVSPWLVPFFPSVPICENLWTGCFFLLSLFSRWVAALPRWEICGQSSSLWSPLRVFSRVSRAVSVLLLPVSLVHEIVLRAPFSAFCCRLSSVFCLDPCHPCDPWSRLFVFSFPWSLLALCEIVPR
jgi:hypothetical protein